MGGGALGQVVGQNRLERLGHARQVGAREQRGRNGTERQIRATLFHIYSCNYALGAGRVVVGVDYLGLFAQIGGNSVQAEN